MTKQILDFYASVETTVNGLVSLIVNIFMFAITTLTPLAAPIAPAFSVYKALSERLETPFSIALAGAISVEITGMFVAKTGIAAHNWNSARNKTDPEAPKGLAIAMAAIFFTVIFILSLTIEINPHLVVWIYPGFVIVAITVYVCLAISNNLKQWEAQKAAELELRLEKNGLSADIRAAKLEVEKLHSDLAKLAAERSKLAADITSKRRLATADSEKKPFIPGDLENLDKARKTKQAAIEDRRNEVSGLYQSGKSAPQIAEQLGYSADTIRRDIKALNGKVRS